MIGWVLAKQGICFFFCILSCGYSLLLVFFSLFLVFFFPSGGMGGRGAKGVVLGFTLVCCFVFFFGCLLINIYFDNRGTFHG